MITNEIEQIVELEPGNIPRSAEIVVVGGSIAGAAAARALALAGREVLLLESRATPNAKRLAGEMMHPRGAVFARWRRSAAARDRTMRLLSCADSSPRTFLEQYLRVLGRAARRPGPGVREMLAGSRRRLARHLPTDAQAWIHLLGPSLK